MSTPLTKARDELLDRLTAALELQLRLVHSTESDPALVAKEHDVFCALLDLIMVNVAGRAAGSAYVAAPDEPASPLDRLATLIRKLDFAGEFLRLAGLETARRAHDQRLNEDRRFQLLKLAEEL